MLVCLCQYYRCLIDGVQELQSHLEDSSPQNDSVLPPQQPLQLWLLRAQTLASQCSMALQQLALVLQCCPEGPPTPGEGLGEPEEPTLRQASPLDAHCQPPGCLMRKGDPAWSQLVQSVEHMLTESRAVKEQLDGVTQQNSEWALHTWSVDKLKLFFSQVTRSSRLS